MQLHLSAERESQLNEYAERHGQDLSIALDEVLANALALDREDHQQTLAAIQRGFEDLQAGRTRPASQVLDELRKKYDLPR